MRRASKGRIVSFSVVLMLVLFGLMLLSGSVADIQAGPDLLPDRDTPTPGRSGGEDADRKPVVAYIQLTVQPAQPGLWALVQWRDAGGIWHNVDGWQGGVDAGLQRWGVFPREFGRGPFRWVLFDGPKGRLLKTSASFYLPTKDEEVVKVSISL
jgi:hypothetical protein